MDLPTDFDEEWASAADWARVYRAIGLQVVPSYTPKESPGNWKRPILSWDEFKFSLVPQARFDAWYGQTGQYTNRANMGLITGLASSGVFCVDLDVKPNSSSTQWWAALLAVHNNDMEPETPAQRTGGGGRQILFRAPDGWSPPTFKTSIGVDIRGQGGFMVCPPSMHESGTLYAWEAGRAPWQQEIEIAPDWLIEGVETLREEHGGTPTTGRERAPSSDAQHWTGRAIDDREDKMTRLVWAVMLDLRRGSESDEPPFPGDIASELERAWEQYLNGAKSRLTPRAGFTDADLLELEGRGRTEFLRKWRRALKQWNGKLKLATGDPKPERERNDTRQLPTVADPKTAIADTTPVCVSFDPWETYAVPNFPVDALPLWIRRWVTYQATSIGVDPSAAAMAALTAISGALDQQNTLKMKRTGNWSVRPRLWCVLVGDPSAKKTPIISAAVHPLRSVEGVGVRKYQKEYSRWKELPKDERDQEPAKPTRYIFNDVTVEKVGDVLSRQDRGALVEHDELSGWIGSMDKYSGGKGSSADRAFWLSAYNGGSKTVDRLGRGEIYIENLCVSFLGGIQPDRLAQLTDLTSDGLLQRFLPVMMRKPDFAREVEDDAPAEEYGELVKYVTTMHPQKYVMDEGARAASEAFQRTMYELEHMPALGGAFCSFVGKLAGVQGALALVLHIAEDPHHAPEHPVSESTVQASVAIVERFVIPHALALYRQTTGAGDWEEGRTAASYILTSDLDRFRPVDFTRNVRPYRGLAQHELVRKLSVLVAGGWLSEETINGHVRAWVVTPGLREQFAERRRSEAEEKAKVIQRLQNLKGSN